MNGDVEPGREKKPSLSFFLFCCCWCGADDAGVVSGCGLLPAIHHQSLGAEAVSASPAPGVGRPQALASQIPHRHGVVYVYLAGTAAAPTELQNSPGARRAGVVALAHLFLPLTICRIRMTERKRERVDGRWSHVVDRLCSIGSQDTVVICVSCRVDHGAWSSLIPSWRTDYPCVGNVGKALDRACPPPYTLAS